MAALADMSNPVFLHVEYLPANAAEGLVGHGSLGRGERRLHTDSTTALTGTRTRSRPSPKINRESGFKVAFG